MSETYPKIEKKSTDIFRSVGTRYDKRENAMLAMNNVLKVTLRHL